MGGTILTNDLVRGTKLYRIVRKDRFYWMLASHQNALARPKRWDDTFENLALNSKIQINGAIGNFSFKDDIYGQCWTLESYSDAMWRIYSHGTDGIRIRTTVGKLIDSLATSRPKDDAISCFIGKVKYSKESKLKKFADQHFAGGLGSDGKRIAESLLIKRNAFRHEKEVRLVYLSPDSEPLARDFYVYNIDPHDLIDQVMLHPQLRDHEAAALKQEIQNRMGWKGKLVHSKLYRLPKGFLFKVAG